MTLQIEAGKYYRTRDGRKVGPMVFCGEWEDEFPWCPERLGGCYSDTGVRQNIFKPDLIAEWTDEPAQPAPLDLAALAKQHGIRITVAVGEMSMTFDGRE